MQPLMSPTFALAEVFGCRQHFLGVCWCHIPHSPPIAPMLLHAHAHYLASERFLAIWSGIGKRLESRRIFLWYDPLSFAFRNSRESEGAKTASWMRSVQILFSVVGPSIKRRKLVEPVTTFACHPMGWRGFQFPLFFLGYCLLLLNMRLETLQGRALMPLRC